MQGDPFDVDVEPHETVEALKIKIAEIRKDMPSERQKIVHAGKILSDNATLEECGVKDGDFVVITLSKPKPAVEDSTPASCAPPPPAPAPAEASIPVPVAAPADAMEATIQMLVEMGFPRDQVRACLRAAFGNPDRAVEYLMGGIPANLQHHASGAPPPPPQAAGAHGGAPGAGFFPPMPPQPPVTGPLAELGNHPRFHQLRMAVQQEPRALNQVISHIAQANPNMISMIAEHQEEFVNLLAMPMATGVPPGGDPVAAMLAAAQAAASSAPAAPAPAAPPPAPPAPPAAVELTAAEEEAIGRLTSLGFERRVAVEAYLACNRNEEIAANYLFEAMEQD